MLESMVRGIQNAREYAASYEQACIDDPSIPESLKAVYRQTVQKIISGELDNNFTVWQRMQYFLTGQEFSFLNK